MTVIRHLALRAVAVSAAAGLIGLAGGTMPTVAAAQDAAPSAPALSAPLVAPCSPFGLQLTWSASSDDVAVARYEVIVARAGQLPLPIATVAAPNPQPATYTHFLDGDGSFRLFDGATYTVSIRAVDSAGQQAVSAQQPATMPPAAPAPVTGLQGALTGSQVALRWDVHPSACSFAVRRDDDRIAALPAGAAAHVDGAPLHGRTAYSVVAIGHSSVPGQPASVTVAEPLPTVAPRPTCAWRDTPISARRLSEVNTASMCLMNFERVRAGLAPMWVDTRLQTAAGRHARDEAARNFFSHVNPDGCNANCRANAAGYPGGTGENLYAGPPTAAEAVDGWMGSAGHRFNILDPEYRTLGSGTAMGGPFRRQWVQTFGPIGAPLLAVSAVTGLESRFQGRANPDAPVAANLRISEARLTRAWRLKLTATLASRADGGRIRIRARGRGRTVEFSAPITRGRARLDRTLPRRIRARPLTITVSYAGNSRVRSGSARRRVS